MGLIDQLRISDDIFPEFEFPLDGISSNGASSNNILSDVTLPKKSKDWFIKGPIWGTWLSKVAALPGKYTLHVALVIWYGEGLPRNGESHIVVNRFHFDRLLVKKDSVRRSLKRLQDAGLILYTKIGQRYHITVLDCPEGITNP